MTIDDNLLPIPQVDKVASTRRYRARRAASGEPITSTSRIVATTGRERGHGMAAPVDAETVAMIEAIVDTTIAKALNAARDQWGASLIPDSVAVRRDWTHRTFVADKPRSRASNAYSEKFRNLDYAVFDGVGVGMSLRLAKYAAPTSHWREYKPFNHAPLIGGRTNISHERILQLLTVHELAHVIDYVLPIDMRIEIASDWQRAGLYIPCGKDRDAVAGPNGETAFIGGHEASWQGVYARLRDDLGLRVRIKIN